MAVYSRRFGLNCFHEVCRPSMIKSFYKKQISYYNKKFYCKSSRDKIPLNEPLHVGSQPQGISPVILNGEAYETRITILENGLKVASEESFGQFSTVGGKLMRIIW